MVNSWGRGRGKLSLPTANHLLPSNCRWTPLQPGWPIMAYLVICAAILIDANFFISIFFFFAHGIIHSTNCERFFQSWVGTKNALPLKLELSGSIYFFSSFNFRMRWWQNWNFNEGGGKRRTRCTEVMHWTREKSANPSTRREATEAIKPFKRPTLIDDGPGPLRPHLLPRPPMASGVAPPRQPTSARYLPPRGWSYSFHWKRSRVTPTSDAASIIYFFMLLVLFFL